MDTYDSFKEQEIKLINEIKDNLKINAVEELKNTLDNIEHTTEKSDEDLNQNDMKI